jgi:hypothetical protein
MSPAVPNLTEILDLKANEPLYLLRMIGLTTTAVVVVNWAINLMEMVSGRAV